MKMFKILLGYPMEWVQMLEDAALPPNYTQPKIRTVVTWTWSF